jgi:hypothetical protein
VLKNLLSKFQGTSSQKKIVIADYSELPASEIAARYDESYSTLTRYVEFAWEALQQPKPTFGVLQDRALAVEISHNLFFKYYGDYLGTLKELERSGIHPKSLSASVLVTIEQLTKAWRYH